MKRNKAIHVKVDIIGSKKDCPSLVAYAYDSQGKFLGSETLREDACKLEVVEPVPRQVRLFVGPEFDEKRVPTLSELQRIKAVERRIVPKLDNPVVVEIPEDILKYWIVCLCIIRGRVVVREEQPDGTVKG